MKLITFIISMCWKPKSRVAFFTTSLSEGIKDLFSEMGYRFRDNNDKI